MSASCKTRYTEAWFAFLEQDIPWDVRVFCLFSEGDNQNCLEFAPVDRISLHYNHRSPVFWLRSFWAMKIRPKNITLTNYHLFSISWTPLISNISSANALHLELDSISPKVQRLHSHHHTSFCKRLYGKTDRFHIPINLPAIADLVGYGRSVHDRRSRRVWNMVFGNYVAKPASFTRTSGLQFCPCP